MKGAAMPLFIDSPSGGRPPKRTRTIGVRTATALVVGSMASVQAAHGREEAMA
jgi:hypothetical protein